MLGAAADLAAGAEDVGRVAFVAHQVPDGTTADGIRKLALDVRGRLPAQRAAVVLIAGVPADRPAVVVAVNDAAREAGPGGRGAGPARRPARWAGVAAAGTTSPRAAARRRATALARQSVMLLMWFGRL